MKSSKKKMILEALESYLREQQEMIHTTKLQIGNKLKSVDNYSREADIQTEVLCPQSNHWTAMAKTNQDQLHTFITSHKLWLTPKNELNHGSLIFITYKDDVKVPRFYRGRKKIIMYLPFGGMILDVEGQEVIVVSYAARCMQHILGLKQDPNIKSFEVLAY